MGNIDTTEKYRSLRSILHVTLPFCLFMSLRSSEKDSYVSRKGQAVIKNCSLSDLFVSVVDATMEY